LRETLESAYTLGVRKHSASRFEQYARVLEECGQRGRLLEGRTPERHRLIFEAASQAQQLRRAFQIWSKLDPSLAFRKVEEVLGGGVLPRNGTDHDPARNTLFEFMVASVLHGHGFAVHLTQSEEDVSATHPAFASPLAIECKRPSKPATVRDNLRELRKQLRERCADGTKQGVGVIGIDRLAGLSGKTPNVAVLQQVCHSA
jgi:hypothetical protein